MPKISSEEAKRVRDEANKLQDEIIACKVQPLMVRSGQGGHYTIALHQWEGTTAEKSALQDKMATVNEGGPNVKGV